MTMMENIHTHKFYAMGSHMTVWLEYEEADVATAVLDETLSNVIRAQQKQAAFLQSEIRRLKQRQSAQ